MFPLTRAPTTSKVVFLSFCVIATFLFTATFAVFYASNGQLSETLRFPWTSSQYKTVQLRAEEDFIKRALESEIGNPYDGSSLRKLCADVQWQEGLMMSCTRVNGGIGNVRNIILNCLRFSIEAGAAFVIPDIQTRAASDLSDLGGENIAFSTFFDVDHLMHSLKRDCPQMKVIQRQDLPPDKPYVLNPFTVSPQILVDDIFDHTLMVDPKQWRPSFDNWLGRKLGKHLATSKSSSSEPIFVVAVSPLFNWPADYDGEAFKRNFGKVLRFPHEIRVLAAKTLYAVSHEFKIQLQSTGITPNAFFAAHLRTEADATKSGYTSYDVQASSYLKQAEAKNLTKIYAASGSLEELQRFTNDAIDRGMVVTTKFELLTEDNLDQLEALRWDQQALIDFEVLLRASSFAGIEASSFAFNIALLRHELSDMDGFLQGWGGQNFEDEYSCLYGLPARIPRLQQGVYP